MASVTVVLVVPAGSDDGEKVAVALGGNGEVENVTGPPREPFEIATFRVKLADWPAATAEVEAAAVTLKSATEKVSAGVVPPPGDGLLTVIASVAPGVRLPAGRTAVRVVELTTVVLSATLPA